MTAPLFEKVALLGIGLIGSSLARAIRARGLAGQIAVYTRREETLRSAEALELGDSYTLDPAEAVQGADLVVVCVPLGAYDAVGRAMAPGLTPGVIVTDVGSVKQPAIRDLGPYLPGGGHLVPGHPVAGTENSGPEAGLSDLFEGRWTILTPPPGAEETAVDRISELWRRCGSRVEIMEAAHHDRVLAMTSHLPHIIAYTIVGTAFELEESERAEVIKFSAGGFRDFTRIAGSDPIMWRDIFLNNRDSVLEMLQRFSEDLTALQRAIRWGEGETLESLFRRTREIRQGVVEAHQAGTFDAREPTAHPGTEDPEPVKEGGEGEE